MSRSSLLHGIRGLTLAVVAALALAATAAAGTLTVTLQAGDHRLVDLPAGPRWESDAGRHADLLLQPGAPRLPAEHVMLLLPPGARFEDLQVVLTGTAEVAGSRHLPPVPPLLPLPGPGAAGDLTRRLTASWEADRRAIYARDEAYPAANVRVTGTGTLRQYAYVAVSFCPFTYHPRTGRLYRHAAARLDLSYTVPAAVDEEVGADRLPAYDRSVAIRAQRLFVNYEQMKGLYPPPQEAPAAAPAIHDYVIVTTEALVPAIDASGFVAHKTARGHTVRTVATTDAEISAQPGGDLPARIRNFLRAYYAPWGIRYVLLVGDQATLPARYCFADPGDHSHAPANYPYPGGSVPTDHYYADLSHADALSWDADGDGFHGEYGQDAPDFVAEVAVGRIPTADAARVTYTLDKLVRYEQDSGDWKSRALHGGAILFYENQDHSSIPFRDGADCMDLIATDLMPGWPVSRYSEHEGLAPSGYAWPALTEADFTAAWRAGQYGVVNWAGHGSPDGAWRTIWDWDDGDGVYETDGSDGTSSTAFIADWCDVDDDHPSIVFAVSCNVGYPEPNGQGNLGVDLLTDPALGAAAGVVASSRIAAVTGDWPATPGGAESMCYEFNRHFLDQSTGSPRLGEAFYASKYYCHYFYGWAHYLQYWNMYDYDLYGDPAMTRTGAVSAVHAGGDHDVAEAGRRLRNHPNPFNPRTEFRYRLAVAGPVHLAIYDLRGRRVRVLVDGDLLPAGERVARWDGRDDGGRSVPSGVYFGRLEAGGRVQQHKVLLLK